MKRFCQKERSGLFGSPFQRLLFCCRRVFPVGSVAAGTEAERDDLFGLYGRTDSGCRSVDAGRRLDQECYDNSPVTMGRRALRHHQAIKVGTTCNAALQIERTIRCRVNPCASHLQSAPLCG